jgi:hypothetical protein
MTRSKARSKAKSSALLKKASIGLLFVFLLSKRGADAVSFVRQRYVPPFRVVDPTSITSSNELWGIRGGGDFATTVKKVVDEKLYTAVGFQIVGDISSLSSGTSDGSHSTWLEQSGANFFLLKQDDLLQPTVDDNDGNQKVWKGDEAALESLAICCDVMVIVLVVDNQDNTSFLIDPRFVQALERGLRHRANNGMISSVLILLVSTTSNKDTKLTEAKDRLVLQDLAHLSPKMVTNLEILSLDDPVESSLGLGQTWREVLRDTSFATEKTTSHLVESEAFTRLLHDVYQSKGGKQSSFLVPLEQDELTITPIDTDVITDTGKTSEMEAFMEQEDTTKAVMDASISRVKEETVQYSQEEELQALLVQARGQIRALESKHEQLWLGFSSLEDELKDDEFGLDADRILDQFQSSLQEGQDDKELQQQGQRLLWQQILPPLKQLYNQHLQFLREHYGKQYETSLEETSSKISATDGENADAYQAQWQEAAASVTSSFRQAAQAAIPLQCREGGALRDADFDYVPTLEGLLQDMMQATEDQEELLGIASDVNDNGSDLEANDDGDNDVDPGGRRRFFRRRGERRRKRPAKWYEKVAAKALVLAVNYFQGWLAYQGMKRAAAERDLHLPKFPLF